MFPNSSHSCHYRRYRTYRTNMDRVQAVSPIGRQSETSKAALKKTGFNLEDFGVNYDELRDGIKMVGNFAAVRTLPGRSQDNRCRHYHNEVETLAHVLGFCPHGEALRNPRHQQVRSIIATAIKDADYNTFEEVHGLSVTGTTRHIDIIAFKDSTRSGFVIEPAVLLETNEEQSAEGYKNHHKNQHHNKDQDYDKDHDKDNRKNDKSHYNKQNRDKDDEKTTRIMIRNITKTNKDR
ncbi:hypothetical protein ANN_22878 [Periplaneta americana]|uniref:Uncharacterized protein n=1 Tax=Periplaneta americana TaxID=6978 RepID=A0ABQ8SJN2_PERAM|nr:hypothetical protein ANN_22878 [Periplaneta americana]